MISEWRLLTAALLLLLLASCGEKGVRSQPVSARDDEALADQGKHLYRVSCAACHQEDGLGMEGVGPPLAGSDWVAGPQDELIRIVLHGIHGPIIVSGREYNLEMPAMGFFEDGQLAAVLTYMRNSWGNDAPPVNAESVAATRRRYAGRGDSWTVEELREPDAN